ncbi:MAG: branched-chain amino acid ABC transporter ATP-binding protein/permease [Deltaproteobacteria bacterium]|nr:MAG: branched-chain amino acid ABC transporter ATP-binding protein/permease [Deltaproteobacteria bacterium]
MLKRLILVRGAEIALFVVLGALPLVVDSPFVLGLLTLLAIYGVALIGLDVTVGYLGQINLAQVAMLGLGAYLAGIAATRYGVGIPLAVLLSGVFCTVVGALLALPALRLEGPQFALATLSFTALCATALNELEWLTNGAQGLSITRPLLLGHALDARDFFWLCTAILALVWLAMRNLMTSQWGRAFEALRDSPIATDAMGVGTYRHKVAAFAFGSGLGGAAGALYAFNFVYLQPMTFVYELTVILLLGVVLGGRKSLWGAVVGAVLVAVLVALLPNLLSSPLLFRVFSGIAFALALVAGVRGLVRRKAAAFRALAPIAATLTLVVGSFLASNTEDWRKAIFALLLFSVVVGLPEGLMGFASAGLARLFRVAPPALPPPAPLDAVLPARPADGSVLLKLDALSCHFGGVRAVDGVDLTVKAGTIHGLIGPNGSGKSTLVNVVSGLYAPSGGELRLRGAALPRGKPVAAAKAGIARTFQNLQLFGGMTALENVMVALRGAWRVPLPLVLLGLGRLEELRGRAAALALLELVGLRGEARTRATDLTYGAQRFLEIARALARRPELLILDEPAAGLAQPDVQRLLEIIRRVQQRGITTVLIEHHMDVVSELCETVTVLDGGKVIAEGSPAQVKRDAKVITAYLGAAEPDAAPPGAAPAPAAPAGAP